MLTIRKSTVFAGAVLLAALGLALALLAQPAPTQAAGTNRTRVKLFEAGKVVGEWTSEGGVRTEGSMLVFTVRDGVSSREVRILGTLSAEELN